MQRRGGGWTALATESFVRNGVDYEGIYMHKVLAQFSNCTPDAMLVMPSYDAVLLHATAQHI